MKMDHFPDAFSRRQPGGGVRVQLAHGSRQGDARGGRKVRVARERQLERLQRPLRRRNEDKKHPLPVRLVQGDHAAEPVRPAAEAPRIGQLQHGSVRGEQHGAHWGWGSD